MQDNNNLRCSTLSTQYFNSQRTINMDAISRTQTLTKHLGMPTKHFLLTLTSRMSAFRYNTLQLE